jgi:beta-mannosidase
MKLYTLSLDGPWTLTRAGADETIPATVPGDVYRDLLEAEQIPDPFYRDNENELQWIGETDWTYARSFEVPGELLDHETVKLRCEGLDTFAEITVNGSPIASTDNMFRTWELDVKDALKAGSNEIAVTFRSTMPYIREREAQQRLRYGQHNNPKVKAASHGWVRKEQCNYGWDWGIKAVTCGIWRSISLVAYSTARIADVAIEQDHATTGEVRLAVRVHADAVTPAPLRAAVSVAKDGSTIAEATADLTDHEASAGAAHLTIAEPELWWPNGLGGQPLYEVRVELLASEGPGGSAGRATSTGADDDPLDATARRIGLRTLRLDRHDDEWGESFQFVVNGVPFFAKGANWIPADGIQTRMTPERYRALVEDAAAANMNMLRVWGGGIYEEESFYDACDELGICIWQDFMFACAAYPVFEERFLANCEAEARDNARRLRHHPSLALWCGNNELEQMHLASDRGWEAGEMPWEEYKRLFDHILADVVAELNPATDYWPSSPHTPRGDRNDIDDPRSGDAHLWGVWHRKEPFEWYRACEHRFNSEFGFQSFPEPRTVATYAEPRDRNVTSWVMEHHQRSGIGNSTIMQYMLDWFQLPVGFENTLWASQILQGMAMKYACEHWRRSMPRGMGTLYWQINDTWPVASWASIDYFGRWKALHYMARRFFAPVIVSGLEDAEAQTVGIHVTNDLREERSGVVTWTVTDLAGETLREDRVNVTQGAGSTSEVAVADLGAILAEHGPRGILVWLSLESGGTVISRDLVLFSRPKHLELAADPGIEVELRQVTTDEIAVTLSAKAPALWCWLEFPDTDVRYSDNFFHLRPGESRTITVTPASSPLTPATGLPSLDQLKKRLAVRSLVDLSAEA